MNLAKATAGDGDLKDRVRCCNQTKIADLQSANDNITFKLKLMKTRARSKQPSDEHASAILSGTM